MSKFRFDKKAQAFRIKKHAILDGMANNAVNYFKVTVFDQKSFDGVPWAPNKVQDGRQQLVDTGRMRNSITVLRRSENSRVIGSNVPYAQYHNSGTNKLPKRKFIGKSRELDRMNLRYLEKHIRQIV